LRDSKGNEATYVIKGGSPYKTIYRLAFSEITSRNDAENLIESEVLVEKALLPDLDEDEHYWFEIIGLDVFQTDDAYLGTIDSIIPTGSNDVYVVKHPEKETLIPALQSVVVKIDLPNNRMVVELPEGL
jgi:16S rRNA processing protein RimM